MLPPFHIRNLWSPLKESQETLVRINAPYYDDTISHNPAAALKYYDEDDGDLITVASLQPESLCLLRLTPIHTAWLLQRADGEA